jgi:two-component SAPR family response regulator
MQIELFNFPVVFWYNLCYNDLNQSTSRYLFLVNKMMNENSQRLQINCFSRFSMRLDGTQVDLHSGKAEELLALLVCEPNGVSTSKAVEMMWPAAPPVKATAELYKIIKHLQMLINGGLPLPLTVTRGALSLNTSQIEIDFVTFAALERSEKAEDWERSVELYSGVLLSDNRFDWAVEYESVYDVVYYDLLARLQTHFNSRGDNDKARYYRDKLPE